MPRVARLSVVAVALFAATWAVCELLAGLGAGISLALAGVVTVSTVPWVFRTSYSSAVLGRVPRREARPRRADEFAAQPDRAAMILERPPRRAGGDRAPRRPQTLVTQYVRIVVDDAGFEVKKRRKTGIADDWEEHLRMRWSAVTAMKFATGRHDPIVALYAWTIFGKRHHVADSSFLSRSDWTQLSKLIAGSTGDRLTLDLTERDNPRTLLDS